MKGLILYVSEKSKLYSCSKNAILTLKRHVCLSSYSNFIVQRPGSNVVTGVRTFIGTAVQPLAIKRFDDDCREGPRSKQTNNRLCRLAWSRIEPRATLA